MALNSHGHFLALARPDVYVAVEEFRSQARQREASLARTLVRIAGPILSVFDVTKWASNVV